MRYKQIWCVIVSLVWLAGCGTNPPEVPADLLPPLSAADTAPAQTKIPDTTAPEETTAPEPPVIDVAGIALRIHDVSFHAGETVAPQATVSPADAADLSLLWVTSDPAVAVVDENGVITGVAQGTCTITAASVQNPAVTDAVTVTVVGEDECTYIDGILIANKTYPLPKSYAPGMDQEAFTHICTMFSDAKAAGLTLWVKSSYRSYYDQRYIYNGYAARDGQEAADRYSARAGHSEHQSGLAFDLNELTFAFGDSPEGIWLAENCHKYGFILRYPKDKEEITGYMYEPWHVRYIGKEKAAAIHESGLCLEEYLGITSVYGD